MPQIGAAILLAGRPQHAGQIAPGMRFTPRQGQNRQQKPGFCVINGAGATDVVHSDIELAEQSQLNGPSQTWVHGIPGEAGIATRHRTSINRSEEHTSELQSLMRISYAVFCLKKKQTIDRSDPQITLNN